MRQSPALKIVLLLATGIILARWNNLSFNLLLPLTCLLLLFSIIFNRGSVGQILLCLTLLSSGAAAFKSSLPPDRFPPTPVTLSGTVLEAPLLRDDFSFYQMRVNSIAGSDGKPVKLHGKVWVKHRMRDSNLHAGTHISLEGIFLPNRPQRNPGDFNTKAWRERNGFIGELHSEKIHTLKIIDDNPSLIFRIRNAITEQTEKHGSTNAALLKALLLGIRRDIDPKLKEDLRITGLTHLLALSGLHMGFLVVIMIVIGSIFRLSPSWRYGLALVGIILFLLLVPPRSCTLRAGIMAAAFLSGPIIKRWSPPLNCLAFSALIILCLRPGDLFDAGFQLSFAAIGGIILFFPLIEEFNQRLRRIASRSFRLFRQFIIKPFLISCAATIMILPLTAYHFGLSAFGAPLYNLIALPVLGFIFASAWLMVAISFLWQGFASIIADSVNVSITVWKWMAHIFAIHAPLWSGRLTPLSVAVIISGLTWFALSKRRIRVRLTIVTLIVVTALLFQGALHFPNRFQAWFLDVGHGDAQVWLFPDGRTAVIDGGPASRTGNRGAVAAALDHYGCDEIDLMVASHPEADHIGGLIELVEHYPVKLAICAPGSSSTKTYKRLCAASEAANVSWRAVKKGTKICELPERYDLKILGPPMSSMGWSANDASVVLLLEAVVDRDKKLRLLTTGDIEHMGEVSLVKHGGIQAELLKLPHHGSLTSNSPEFIEAVKPDKAVVSRGGWRERGTASSLKEVLSRLRTQGIMIYHTSLEGAILFEPRLSKGKAEWQSVDWRNPPFIRWLLGNI